MDLTELWRVLRRQWVIVAAVPLVCVGIAAAYLASLPTTYTASTRLYVSMATGTSVNDSYQGGLAAQQRVTSYSHVAGGPAIAEAVVDDLGLRTTPEELQSRISVTFPPATTLLDISATDSSPEGARVLAATVAAQFTKMVGEMETTVLGAAPAAQATVIEPARTPLEPDGPAATRILALGLIGGIALGGLAGFARDRLDRRARDPEQVAAALSAPVLGTVPDGEPGAGIAVAQLSTRVAAARGSRTPANLLLAGFSGAAAPALGMQLAAALADNDRRVVVVDADPSSTGVTESVGTLGYPGLAEWLRNPKLPLDELLRFTDDGVGVLPVGVADERTPRMLVSERFAELLSHLQLRFDHVIVVAAPVSATDPTAFVLSSRCDATLAVVGLATAKLPQLHAAGTRFRESGAELLGAVTTAPPARKDRRRAPVRPPRNVVVTP